jgi:hypothetical protein
LAVGATALRQEQAAEETYGENMLNLTLARARTGGTGARLAQGASEVLEAQTPAEIVALQDDMAALATVWQSKACISPRADGK